jgi:2-iminobutanoate/2-iminopropanoate deaminase
MEDIKAILQAASYNLSDVVQSNVYLSSIALFSEFNNEYGRYFDKVFPTRATVEIELMTDALVEISVVAYKGKNHHAILFEGHFYPFSKS